MNRRDWRDSQRPQRTSLENQPLRFSFRYFDASHPAFDVRTRRSEYFRLLLARLRELSALSVKEFRTSRTPTLRIHPIDFRDQRVSVAGFGIAAQADADYYGWQFALSSNEHGRVHGFLLDDTFYVRWLDPEHNLYPGG